jgi:hypothetical protein
MLTSTQQDIVSGPQTRFLEMSRSDNHNLWR